MNQQKLFGKRIRAIRKAARITQEKAAEAAHLNPKYLGEIERGEKRPSFQVILALGRVFRVSPAQFFDLDQAETNPKILRKRIDSILQKASPQQLQQVYKVLRSLVEP